MVDSMGAGQFDPVNELNSGIYDENPIPTGNSYSKTIDMRSRDRLALYINLARGALAAVTISIEVYAGGAWRTLYCTNASGGWALVVSAATFDGALIVGDTGTIKYDCIPILWPKARVKVATSGPSNTGSSCEIHAAAK